jgi:hypothetical protein
MLQAAVARLRLEAAAVLRPPWRALRAGGLRAFPVTLTCTALIALFALIQHTVTGWWLVEHSAGVYQALPLPLILLRLPLSMFAPAPDLPAWGAMSQVLIVFGFSEIHLGRLRTLVIAICVNGLTTVSARIMVVVGLHWAIGTPQVDQYELDTGPSTVVVALSVYVALICRAYVLLAITGAAMAAEAVALPNLAGREHLVALGLGAAAYLLGERFQPRSTRTARTTRHATVTAPSTGPTPVPATAAPPGGSAPSSPDGSTADTPRPLAPDATPPRPGSRP